MGDKIKVNYFGVSERDKLISDYNKNGYILIGDYSTYLEFIENNSPAVDDNTREQINSYVVELIRQKYSINDEFQMLNYSTREEETPEYKEYLEYSKYREQCVAWGRNKKKELGLE